MNTIPQLPEDVWVEILSRTNCSRSQFQKAPPKSRMLMEAYNRVFRMQQAPKTVTLNRHTSHLVQAIRGFRYVDTLKFTDGCTKEDLQVVASSTYASALSTLQISSSRPVTVALTQEMVQVIATLPALQHLVLYSVDATGCDLSALPALRQLTVDTSLPLALIPSCQRIAALRTLFINLKPEQLAECAPLQQLEEITFASRPSDCLSLAPATDFIDLAVVLAACRLPNLRTINREWTKDLEKLVEIVAFLLQQHPAQVQRLIGLSNHSFNFLHILYDSALALDQFIALLDPDRVGLKPLQNLYEHVFDSSNFDERTDKILKHLEAQKGMEIVLSLHPLRAQKRNRNTMDYLDKRESKAMDRRYGIIINGLFDSNAVNKAVYDNDAPHGELPLFMAIDGKSPDLVERVLRSGANPNLNQKVKNPKNLELYAPLQYLFLKITYFEDLVEPVARLLVANKANPNVRNDDGQTLLHQIVGSPFSETNSPAKEYQARQKLFNVLEASGADMQATDSKGNTVCQLLISNLKSIMQKSSPDQDDQNYLVSEKCSYVLYYLQKDMVDKREFTWLLDLAYQFEQNELIACLKDKGACFNPWDAVRDGLHLLLKKHISESQVNELRDEMGNSLLHVASMQNTPDVVAVLLAKGADVWSTNYQGMRPLELARDHSGRKTIVLLADAENPGASTPDLSAAVSQLIIE